MARSGKRRQGKEGSGRMMGVRKDLHIGLLRRCGGFALQNVKMARERGKGGFALQNVAGQGEICFAECSAARGDLLCGM
eukprot:363500-Chlamydomonas_euryale.AAC.1